MPNINDLHISCLRALKDYMVQANKMCALMDSLEAFPVSQEQRLAVLDQRLQENAAQERYQIARQHFFEALQSSSISEKPSPT